MERYPELRSGCTLRLGRSFSPGAIRLLTWGGLRGGISVALALSLPAGQGREVILAMTYIVAVFSIQGLTIERRPGGSWPARGSTEEKIHSHPLPFICRPRLKNSASPLYCP